MTKKLLAFLFALILATTTAARADLAEDMQAQIDALQRQLNAVKAQLEQIKAQQAAAAVRPTPTPAPGKPVLVKDGTDATFLIGKEAITAYGNLDISYDYTTKGLANYYPGVGSPVGNYGWLQAISTNLSYIGVRGRHPLGPHSGLLYQLETQIDVSSTPGTPSTNSNYDDVVKGALVSRNSFVGIDSPIGAFKIGKTDAPYKNSTARMNPFSGEIGDYSVIMGNTGGDNRVEFGTRLDHSVWYESRIGAASPGTRSSRRGRTVPTTTATSPPAKWIARAATSPGAARCRRCATTARTAPPTVRAWRISITTRGCT